MTDPNIPDPTAGYTAPPPPPAAPEVPPAVPPAPAYQPAAQAYPPAATPYAPVAAGPKQGLSLASFITGLAGFVFSWVPGLGFLAGLAAVILGFIGRKNEPAAPRWMSLVGIIAGFVGIGLNLLFVALLVILPLIAIGNAANDYNNF